MDIDNVKPVTVTTQVRNYITTLIWSFIFATIIYALLILFAGVGFDRSILIAFVVMIAVQLLFELRQYNNLRRETDFLEDLTIKIPKMRKELAILSTRVAARRSIIANRLDDLAQELKVLFNEQESLIIQQTQGDSTASQELYTINSKVVSIRKEEDKLQKEKNSLTDLLTEISIQSEALNKLRRRSKSVVQDMILHIRADLIKTIMNTEKDLRKRQQELVIRASNLVEVPMVSAT